jgi:hypothetical protein
MNSNESWTPFEGGRVHIVMIPPEDREIELERKLQESTQAREEAANIIDDVIKRLDVASRELRKHGAFPLASQLERDRKELGKRVNDIKTP